MKKFADDRYLRIAFLIGGLYDLVLGISLLFFSDFLVEFLNVTKPDNMIFIQISGLFLIAVGYFLIYARLLKFIAVYSILFTRGHQLARCRS